MTAKATVPEEKQHAGQVAESRPDHGDVGLERVGIDDRGDGVGGVVEAVDELEAERDQQRQGQQQIRPDAGDGDRVEVFGDVEDDVAEAAGQGEQKHRDARAAGRLLQPRDQAAMRPRA